jgi:hypothetical protein
MPEPNLPRWQDQKFAGSAWVTNRDAQIAARIIAERNQSGMAPGPRQPATVNLRLARRGRRWRWIRAVVFAIFAIALAAPPKAGQHAHMAGVYLAGAVVFGLLALHQAVRAIRARVPRRR